jgi:hypothetical protein
MSLQRFPDDLLPRAVLELLLRDDNGHALTLQRDVLQNNWRQSWVGSSFSE